MNPLEIKPTRSATLSSSNSPSSAPVDFFDAMVAAVENKRRQQQESMQFAQLEAPTMDDAGISEALHYLEADKPFE